MVQCLRGGAGNFRGGFLAAQAGTPGDRGLWPPSRPVTFATGREPLCSIDTCFSPAHVFLLVLQAINRGAEVIECQNAQVGLDKILGITAFSLDRLLEADPDFLVRGQIELGTDIASTVFLVFDQERFSWVCTDRLLEGQTPTSW